MPILDIGLVWSCHMQKTMWGNEPCSFMVTIVTNFWALSGIERCVLWNVCLGHAIDLDYHAIKQLAI